MNGCVAPAAMLAVAGVTLIEVTVFAVAVTVSVALALRPSAVAPIVVLPAATAVANPDALMVATPLFDELHVIPLVSGPWLPSL